MRNSKFNRGLTFIEVLVVVGIIAVLVILFIVNFRVFQKESDLSDTTEEILNAFRLVQSKTLASEEASQYGVYFDNIASPGRYVLFKGSSYATRNLNFDEIHKLPSSVEIYEINLAGGKEVVFERLTGKALPAGNLSIRLIADPAKTKTIYIESSGLVGLFIISVPAGGRETDYRHVHFNYDQNTQTAVSLHLVFPDYPGDNYDISFQDYLNTDKTEFSWEGIVSVGPVGSKTEQRLKIHTHSLTVMATQFCIHRYLSTDQSYNDKALSVFLDTEELIKYASDAKGTTIKGSSTWVEEPEIQ